MVPLLKLSFPILFIMIIGGCDTTQKTSSSTEPAIQQLNILLKQGVKPEKLAANFTKYKLTKSKGLSFTENRWIFTFDANLISTEEIVKELKNRPAVLEVKSIN